MVASSVVTAGLAAASLLAPLYAFVVAALLFSGLYAAFGNRRWTAVLAYPRCSRRYRCSCTLTPAGRSSGAAGATAGGASSMSRCRPDHRLVPNRLNAARANPVA